MKKALLAVLAVALVMGFAGCDLWPWGQVDYYPAKVGNEATLTVVTRDSTYIVALDSASADDSTWDISSECTAEITLDDDETEVWEFKNQDGNLSYMGFDKKADKVTFYSDKTDTADIYTMPYDLKEGSTWTIGEGDFAIDFEVTGTEDVTVEAGTYTDCLKVTMTPPAAENVTYEGYQWWDKDHGVVKEWYIMKTDVPDVMYMEMESTTELTEFTEG